MQLQYHHKQRSSKSLKATVWKSATLFRIAVLDRTIRSHMVLCLVLLLGTKELVPGIYNSFYYDILGI